MSEHNENFYDEHPSMFRNNPLLFTVSVALIAAFGLGLFVLFAWYLWCKGTRLIVSETEITFETGLLNKSRIDMSTDRVRTVRVDQTIFQRMFGTGMITVYTAGDNPEFSVNGMPDPMKVRDIIRAVKPQKDRI